MAFQLLLRFPGHTNRVPRGVCAVSWLQTVDSECLREEPLPSRAFRTTAGFLSVDFRFVDNVM
jgi:hypothetical protein